MKVKSVIVLLCCLVFALSSGFAAASETKQAPEKAISSSPQPADSGGSNSDTTQAQDCKDKNKDASKSGSEEGVPIPPQAPIVPRIAPDEGC